MDNNVWIQKSTGKKYTVVSENGRLKTPDTDKWFDCVIYSPLYENQYEMFAREKTSFYNEFEVYEPDNDDSDDD